MRLHETAAESPPSPVERQFFRGAIAVGLTLGAAWGAWLALRIAAAGSFTALGLHEVNAHGHAQVFGWVGLYVMGLAYGWTKDRQASPISTRGMHLSFQLMAGGLVLRSLGEALVSRSTWFVVPALAGAGAEITAAALCLTLVTRRLRGCSSSRQASDYYVIAALTWLLVQAVYDAVYFAATVWVGPREKLLPLIATWQGPLREIQIYGVAMLMLLGVSLEFLTKWYGWRRSSQRASLVVLGVINTAILGVALGLILMQRAGHAWAGLWYLSVLALAAATAALVGGWRIWRPASRTDAGVKFMRAGYAWLLLSLAMSAALPAYQFLLLPWLAPASHAAVIGFSHAYYGAIRHAVTVGFASQILIGVSARLLSESRGLRIDRLPGLTAALLLLNLGCSVRVFSQALTDISAVAFPAAGMSGLVEVAALAIWAVPMWRLMERPLATASHSQESLLFPHL